MASNLFLQLYGELGIPIHSRELAEEYLKISPATNITPIFTGNISSLSGTLRKKISRPNSNLNTFIFWYPESFDQLVGVFKDLTGYFIFEYNKIRSEDIEILNKLDCVTTASEWGKKVLIDNGVKRRVEVVHGGVNITKFNKTFRNKWNGSEQFVFGHVGKYENRKNTNLLVKCFLNNFKNNKNVKLLLSVNNPHINVNPRKEIESLFGHNDNIEFVEHEVKDIRMLYKRMHCGVYPTNGEGIGLPIVESMAIGMPVIVSNNTGVTEYANNENSFLLNDLKEIPVYDKYFFSKEGVFGTWMTPTEEELTEKMKFVYDNYEMASIIGNSASSYMENNFTWKQAAQQLFNIMEKDNEFLD